MKRGLPVKRQIDPKQVKNFHALLNYGKELQAELEKALKQLTFQSEEVSKKEIDAQLVHKYSAVLSGLMVITIGFTDADVDEQVHTENRYLTPMGRRMLAWATSALDAVDNATTVAALKATEKLGKPNMPISEADILISHDIKLLTTYVHAFRRLSDSDSVRGINESQYPEFFFLRLAEFTQLLPLSSEAADKFFAKILGSYIRDDKVKSDDVFFMSPTEIEARYEQFGDSNRMQGGLIVLYGKAGSGKSLALRKLALHCERKYGPNSSYFLEMQEPSPFSIGSVKRFKEIISLFLNDDSDNSRYLFIDSLSHLLYMSGNLGAGGVSYSSLGILADISAKLALTGKLCFAVVNPLQNKIYSETLEALIGASTGVFEIGGGSLVDGHPSNIIIGGSLRYVKEGDSFYSRISATDAHKYMACLDDFPWFGGSSVADNTVEQTVHGGAVLPTSTNDMGSTIIDSITLGLDDYYDQ